MLKFKVYFFILLNSSLFAQFLPFKDLNNFFKVYHDGIVKQIEFQPIRSYLGSDHLLTYIDVRGDFRVYDGVKVNTITNQTIVYKLADGQLAWNIGNIIYAYENNEINQLVNFGGNYEVTDSLIVFEDTRFNTLNVRYLGRNIQLVQVTGDLTKPLEMGDNTLVFKENGDLIKFFWRGKTFEFNVYNRPMKFSCGVDIIAFNDPLNQTFTVFDRGELVDLSSFFATSYKAARKFVVFEDNQRNLWYYKNGEKQMLSNFTASFWKAKDDLVIWAENNSLYTLFEGKKTEIANYIPTNYLMKNDILVFVNSVGGTSVYWKGKTYEITKQQNASFEIYGSKVIVGLFNNSFKVFDAGVIKDVN